MTPENFDVTLETLMSRRPFRPFIIELHGGSRLEIDHPRAAFRHGVAVFISPGGAPTIFDHEGVVRFIDAPAHAAGGEANQH